MAIAYTRQSSFADGDTITAALFNDEYNQLVNAFAYSSSNASTTGHRHDGTAGQGGNIPQIGDLDFLNKIVVDSTNNRWGIFVEVGGSAVEQIRFQDGALLPVTDSDVDLGTSSLYFKDAFIDSITTTGNVAVGGNLTVTGTTTFNGGTITMGDAATDNVVFGADVDSNIIPDDDNTYDLGSSSQEWKDLYVDGIAYLDGINFNGTAITATAAELNILDGVTSTAAELNILDGVTSTATELNLLDGSTANTVVNSKAVIYGPSGELAGTLSTAAQTNITSLGTLTTLTVDDITINGSTISDSASLTIDVAGDIILDADDGDVTFVDGGTTFGKISNSAGNLLINSEVNDKDIQFNGKDGGLNVTALQLDMSQAGRATFSENVIVTGELSAATLDISGDVDVDGTLEADAITVNGTTLAETISDTVGAMVTSNTETGVTVTYDDSDNTLDFVIGTLNQDTTGNAATATALETARTIHGVSFDGTANIDLTEVVQDTVGAMFSSNTETGLAVTYEDSDGTIDVVLAAAQPTVTSLGTLTTLTVDDITINGSTISDAGDLTLDVGGDIILDADDGFINLKDGGTEFGTLFKSSDSFFIKNPIVDGDIKFQVNDGGSGVVAFQIDASDAGTVIFNNKVGIGTTSPATTLEVNNASAGATVATFEGQYSSSGDVKLASFERNGGAVAAAITYADANTNMEFGTTTSHSLSLTTADTTRVTIDTSGNVGIGTTSPNQKLNVSGGRSYFGANGEAFAIGLGFNGTRTAANQTYFLGATDSATPDLQISNADGGEKVRITHAGNVGIGTTSPDATLHVSGTATITGNTVFNSGNRAAGNSSAMIRANSGFSSASTPDFTFFFNDQVGLFHPASGTLGFTIDGSEAMRLDSSGNLALGRTSASARLHVQGPADTSTISTSSTPAARINNGGAISLWVGSNNYNYGYIQSIQDDGSNNLKPLNLQPLGGNVGIGTGSPSANLHVSTSSGDCTVLIEAAENASGSEPRLQLKGTNTSSNPIIEFGDSAAFPGSIEYENSDNSMRLTTNTSEAIRIDSSQNVGIGTTSPGQKLDVAGSVQFGDGGSAVALNFNATGNAQLKLNGTERMRIDSSGNLLVGSTTDYEGLVQIAATNEAGLFVRDSSVSNSAPYLRVQGQRSDGNTGESFTGGLVLESYRTDAAVPNDKALGTIYFGGNHTNGTESNISYAASIIGIAEGAFNSATDMPTGLAFLTGDAGTALKTANTSFGTERMRIDSSGNIGIGQTPVAFRNLSNEVGIQYGKRGVLFADSGLTTDIANNTFVDGSSTRVAMEADLASYYQQYQGNHMWFNAASVSAGAAQTFTERMRIHSDGHVLLGTTSNQGVGGLSFEKGGLGFTTHNNNNGASGGYEFYVFRRSSTQIGSIAQNGTTGIQLNTSSDARLKDVTGSARGLDVINNLNPVAYNWKADNRADEGLIAQEVEEFMPNAVSQTKDGYYMMDYSKLVTPLVKAIQEQQEQIESLKSEIAILKGE